MESLELTENPWLNKSILITGSNGLLGSWLTKNLIQSANKVAGISLSPQDDNLIKSFKLTKDLDHFYFDISDFDSLKDIFIKFKFDIVYHLAAQTQVLDAVKDPLTTFNSNIKGTWNILELCKENNIPVVVASSDKAYGESPNLPYEESDYLNGIYPYDVSKTVTDLLCRTYYETYKLNVGVLRCGNIYGGGDMNWDRLIPGSIKSLLNIEQPVLRSDGKFVREWIYVEDVVQAYEKMGIAVINNKNNYLSYNFSSGESYKVIDIYNKISLLIKNEIIEPKYIINSNEEIPNQTLNSSLIKKDLNIESIYNFEDSITKTIDWYKSYFKNKL
tara:strand:+ start:750 stop:1742 length:993 start_codon:yes stop_codon:yes gene_type:complete